MPFEGSTAIVTGGASGLGLAITETLAERGTKVAMFDIQALEIDARVERLRAEVEGQRLHGRHLQPGAVDAAVAQVRDELGPVLILVNSAGIEQFGKFADITDEFWDRVMAVNLRGPFICVQEVLPDMLAAAVGSHRQHLVVQCAGRSVPHGGLRQLEGRIDRIHKGFGAGIGTQGDHREHHSAGHGGHADAGEGDRRRAFHRLHWTASPRSRRCVVPAGRRTSPMPRCS